MLTAATIKGAVEVSTDGGSMTSRAVPWYISIQTRTETLTRKVYELTKTSNTIRSDHRNLQVELHGLTKAIIERDQMVCQQHHRIAALEHEMEQLKRAWLHTPVPPPAMVYERNNT